MDLSVLLYLVFLAAFGAVRLIELRVSARNQRRLEARGVARVPEPAFPYLATFHVAVPVAAAFEVLFLRRPFLPELALTMGFLFLLAQTLRWWVIRTLGEHWNVRVMASAGLGVVSGGPYRFARHPNYAAVFVEMAALPLIHTAWVTSLASAPVHAFLLRRRIAVEQRVLLADPGYRATMEAKPLFVPRLRFLVSWLRGAGAPPGGKRA
jgi:methyltransferase